MMARVVTKIGDLFEVKLDGVGKKYFQLIAFDLTQLNSDVIRAFKEVYANDAAPEIADIIHGEVDFYAHCVTKFGVKMGLWRKVGSSQDVGIIDNIYFRGTADYGQKTGEARIVTSERWHVWRINEEQKFVGRLTGAHRRAEIGLVVTPADILERLKTGRYSFFYPGFE